MFKDHWPPISVDEIILLSENKTLTSDALILCKNWKGPFFTVHNLIDWKRTFCLYDLSIFIKLNWGRQVTAEDIRKLKISNEKLKSINDLKKSWWGDDLLIEDLFNEDFNIDNFKKNALIKIWDNTLSETKIKEIEANDTYDMYYYFRKIWGEKITVNEISNVENSPYWRCEYETIKKYKKDNPNISLGPILDLINNNKIKDFDYFYNILINYYDFNKIYTAFTNKELRVKDISLLEGIPPLDSNTFKKIIDLGVSQKHTDLSHINLKRENKLQLQKYLYVFIKRQRNLLYKNKRMNTYHRQMAIKYESEGKLNQAIWSYQNAGEEIDLKKATELDRILTIILNDGVITEKEEIGKGVFNASKVKLELKEGEKKYTIYAVMKKETNNVYSNYRSEKFASILNDFLGIHVVPKTIIRNVEGINYSLQYFWDGEKNRTPTDEIKPYINDLHLFDYLTENADRHNNNYFTTHEKSICNRRSYIVGIDHGALWGNGGKTFLIVRKMSKLIPSIRFFIALVRMDTEQFKQMVLDEKLATAENLKMFFDRREKIIDFVYQQLKRRTIKQLWPDITTHFEGTPPKGFYDPLAFVPYMNPLSL